jgi:hypothetical protein
MTEIFTGTLLRVGWHWPVEDIDPDRPCQTSSLESISAEGQGMHQVW